MTTLREFVARLRDWRRRDRLDDELAEELRFHRAHLEQDNGVEQAQRRLGNLTRLKEEVRDMWSIPWLDQFQQDVRYAVRGLKRSPGFAATVIVTLGLGIGANAAMFGVIDRLMFRPYPYLQAPSRVHRVYLRYNDRTTRHTESGTEYTRYLDLQKWTSSFDLSSAFTSRTTAVGVGDASRERRVAMVNAAFFQFFDAPPVMGRYFTAVEDSIPRGADVVVLGYGFWKTEFGGRDMLGQVIQIGNISLTVIGVAPRGFAGVFDTDAPVAYMPITTYAASQPNQDDAATYYTTYNWGWMEMMARRKPGVTVAQANADLSNAYLRSWNAERALEESIAPVDIARPDAVAGPMRPGGGPDPSLEARTARWVTGVAVIVLLIACANVANLFLARALKRQRELAVRLALGVSRGRLVRQSLTESLVLSGLGCVAGLLVAQWGGAGVRGLLTSRGASLDVLTDWRTIGVAVTVALIAGLLTGITPALLWDRRDLAGSLKTGSREGTYQRSRTRSALMIAQGALSVVLLVGAGLFVKSLNHVRNMRLGYDADPVIMAVRNLRGMRLDSVTDVLLGRRLLETARSLPNVEHAAWVSSVPFYSRSSTGLYITGIDSVRRLGRFMHNTTVGDYFGAMGTRILRGRGLLPEDRQGTPRVAVVSESMGRVLWPGKDPIGECMRVGADTMPCTTVVGIAEDIVVRDFSSNQRYNYYLPAEQFQPRSGFALMLRMKGDPAAQQESVRKALQQVMPGQSYVTLSLFGDMVDNQRRSWRMGATMFVAFGVLALVVAAIGLYGVVGYNVAQRMHELGVRIALGAQRADILTLVVSQSLRFALAGTVAGVALAWVAGRWVQPLLFEQSARDPVVFGAVAGMLLLVALIASAVPARRATRADPNSALRSD